MSQMDHQKANPGSRLGVPIPVNEAQIPASWLIGIGEIPTVFPARSGRDGAGFGNFGVCESQQEATGVAEVAEAAGYGMVPLPVAQRTRMLAVGQLRDSKGGNFGAKDQEPLVTS